MQENKQELIAISKMSVGQKALIVSFIFDTDKGEHIQEMGFIPGEQLEVMRLSPSGDSVEIKIRGYFLSLKKDEADRIMVKLFSAPS